MYTVGALIEQLKWYNQNATVTTHKGGANEYLDMTGSSQNNCLLLFSPKDKFKDFEAGQELSQTSIYLKECACGRWDEVKPCYRCQTERLKRIIIRKRKKEREARRQD